MYKIDIKIIFLILLLFFHILSNYQVLTCSKVVRICDENAQLTAGLQWFNQARHAGRVNIFNSWDNLFTLEKAQAHPRFFAAIQFLAWNFLASIGLMDFNWMILLVNSVFLLILIFSVYGLGSIIYSKDVGVISALLLSFFPVVFGLSRIAMLDFPLMAMVTLSFYLLFRTRKFSSIIFSILFGLVFGFAQITKETAVLFVIVPLVYYFLNSYSEHRNNKVIINLLLALFCFSLVAGSVFLRRENFHVYSTYMAKVAMHVFKPGWRDHVFLLSNAIGPGVFLIFLVTFFTFFSNFNKRDKFISIWIFVPLLIFCLFPNRSLRYILPIVPAWSLVMARELVLYDLFQKHKKIVIYILVIILLAQYLLINAGYLDDTRLPNNRYDYFSRGLLSARHDPSFMTSMDLFAVFKREYDGSNVKKTILIMYDFPQMHQLMYQKIVLADFPFSVQAPLEADEVDIGKLAESDMPLKSILSADYLMDKTGYQRDFDTPIRRKIKDEMDKAWALSKESFVQIAEVATSNDDLIKIYKRRK